MPGTSSVSDTQSTAPSCWANIRESKWTDAALITGFVALLVIGVVASIGGFNAIGTTHAAALSYSAYSGALLLLIGKIAKFKIWTYTPSSTVNSDNRTGGSATTTNQTTTQQELSPVDLSDNSWKPPVIPPPLNEKERKLRIAKQELIDIEETNPYYQANRYRVYYKVGGMIKGPDPRGYRQCWDNPWEKACERGDVEAMKTFLSNPYFKASCRPDILATAIKQNNRPVIKAHITNPHTAFYAPIWYKDLQDSFSLLGLLIRKGQELEESIHCLLDQGYDVNLLEEGFDQIPGYQTLSEECRAKIEKARKIDRLDKNKHTALEQAIVEGNLRLVQEQLDAGACINHDRGLPLVLAIGKYMARIPGNSIQICAPGGKFDPAVTPEELAVRREIVEIILENPRLRIAGLRVTSIWESLCSPYKPKKWEELVARCLRRGVDFCDVKTFVFQMQFEQLPEDSPIFAALSEEQKAAIEQCRNVRFMHTLFELDDGGHMSAEVYKMLQKLWGSLRISPVMTQAFCEETINKLTQAIQHIPIVFRDGDEQQLLRQIQEGLPVIIPAGWEGHATSIVFYKNRLILGNRGAASEDFAHGLHIYTYDPSKLQADLLKELPQTHVDKKGFFAHLGDQNRFENSLIGELGAIKEEQLPMSSQTKGNCTWASSAYLGVFSALYCLAGEFDRKDLRQVFEFMENEFEPLVKLTTIQNYITDYKKSLKIAWFTHDDFLFHQLFSLYYKQAEKFPEDEDSPQKRYVYEVIDTLIYSGLTLSLSSSKDQAEWLEKRYQIPWE